MRLPTGPTHARARVIAFAAALVTLVSVQVGIAPAQASSTVNSRFFGMHVPDLDTAYPEVDPGAVNLTLNNVYWPQLEPTEGQFDFTELDKLVNQAHANSAQPLLVLGLTPSWAATTQPAE